MEARGFLNQSTDMEGLDAHFASGARAVYLGCDPSADSLHIGHLVPVMMMRWLQKFGHRPILLVGGATGQIGDPDKDTERPLLDMAAIAANLAGLKRSYEKFVRFECEGAAAMVDNNDWFKDVGYLSFLREVGTCVSVNKLITLDRIKKRLDADLHLSFLELNYPLLQSYDFMILNRDYGCTVQICGADQWGNAIGGVDLIRRKTGGESFVLTAPLLTAANGQKMGKTMGNAAWVNEDRASAFDYYQYFRNADDAMVGKMLRIFTELSLDEIARLEALEGAELNEAKKILAYEATKICRGEEAARSAEAVAAAAFEQGSGEGLPQVRLIPKMSVVDAVVAAGFASSNSEARRLISGGGVVIDDAKIEDAAATAMPGILTVGKKRKAVLK